MRSQAKAAPVEKKAPTPKRLPIVVKPEVRLHPTVTATSCARCTFLDRNARLCELFDVELDYVLPTSTEFARDEACVDAEAIGAPK